VHIVTSRPSAVRVRLARRPSAPATLRRQLLTAVDLIVRAFLVGVALGMFIAAQGHAVISVVVPGIAAIGIALVSWDR
jgi:hypothetical protein